MIRTLCTMLAAGAVALVLASPLAAAPTAVAVGKAGQTAYEFVGRVDQNGPSFTFYGYVTYVRGLADDQIFTQPGVDQSEATARITFYATTTMVRRAIVGGVFAVTSTGSYTVYLGSGGASFDDASSFTRGQALATTAIRFQNIINVQSGGSGGPPGPRPTGPGPGGAGAQAISTGTGGSEQRTASTFTLGGKQYRFGRKGLDLRVFATGQGTLLDPVAPRSVILLAGSAAVTR
jgi:hypothetical protein